MIYTSRSMILIILWDDIQKDEVFVLKIVKTLKINTFIEKNVHFFCSDVHWKPPNVHLKASGMHRIGSNAYRNISYAYLIRPNVHRKSSYTYKKSPNVYRNSPGMHGKPSNVYWSISFTYRICFIPSSPAPPGSGRFPSHSCGWKYW